MPTSLEMRCTTSTADSSNIIRIIIFRWKGNTYSDLPISDEILELVTSGNAVNSPYISDGRATFEILYDKVKVGVLGQGNAINIWHKRLRLAKKSIKYQLAGTTGIDKIYALFLSDSSSVTHPGINYYFRLNYTDS